MRPPFVNEQGETDYSVEELNRRQTPGFARQRRGMRGVLTPGRGEKGEKPRLRNRACPVIDGVKMDEINSIPE